MSRRPWGGSTKPDSSIQSIRIKAPSASGGACHARLSSAIPIALCNPQLAQKGHTLTNRIAIWTGGILVALIGLDLLLNGASVSVFLARKFLDLVDLVEFWR